MKKSTHGVEWRFKKQRKQPKQEMEVGDRISILPGDIIDKILSHLTLRDAVRSSILSTNWRYNWKNLTTLVFDNQSVPKDKLVQIVDHVLLLHNGLIHKFKVAHSDLVDAFHSDDIDRWILFLSQHPVREFTLHMTSINGDYKLPSSFYLWDKLSHLELSHCWLKPSSTFNGFKNLTSLNLFDIRMDQDLLENMIYMCPLLERLILRGCFRLGHLKIHAPKLTFFSFWGVLEDVSFENTVHLSTVTIYLYEDIGNDHESSLKLINFFDSLPSIQTLRVNVYFLKILAADHMLPRRLPTPCMQLNYLSLGINFDDMEQCQAALCILRSSPNLLKLNMTESVNIREPIVQSRYLQLSTPRAVTKKLMEEDYQNNCFFNRLRFVEIFGVPREMNFINFLLVNSPILERMTVEPYFQESGWEMVKELLQVKRASTHAEIICMDYNHL